jgi:hypothetical protein
VGVATRHPPPSGLTLSAADPPCTAAPACIAAPIEEGSGIAACTGHGLTARGVQQFARRAAAHPLFGRGPDAGRLAWLKRRPHRAGLQRAASDLVALNKIEHQVGRVAGQRDHAPAQIGAEMFFHLVGIMLQAGIDLPAIAARGTPAGLPSLQHSDMDALFGKVQRRGKAGEPAADHHHVDLSIAIQWRRQRRGTRRVGV